MKRLLKLIIAVYYRLKYWNKCKIQVLSSTIINGCSFEGKNSIGKGSYLNHSSLGLGSYMGYGGEFTNCKIGRFCSIGNNVKVLSATHPVDSMVSSHPAFYSDSYFFSFVSCSKFKEHLETERGFECEIGNDVWIGDDVLIKGGITIGDGAVIAMGSIVLHDVKPYSIVAGVPAKEIRKRFENKVVEKLLFYKWWNKPLTWISKNADAFTSTKIIIERMSNEQTGGVDYE